MKLGIQEPPPEPDWSNVRWLVIGWMIGYCSCRLLDHILEVSL